MSNKKNNKKITSIQCSEEALDNWLYTSPMQWIMEGRCENSDDVAMTQLNRFMLLPMECQSMILYKVFHEFYKEVDGI